MVGIPNRWAALHIIIAYHIGYITLIPWLLGIYGNVNHLALGLGGIITITRTCYSKKKQST